MKKLLQRTLGAVALLATAMGFATTASAETLVLPGEGETWNSYTWLNKKATIHEFTFEYGDGSTSLTDMRIYKGQSLTITAPTGYVMTKVEGTVADGNKATDAGVSEGWTVSTKPKTTEGSPFAFTATTGQSSIKFNGKTSKENAQFRISTLTITYGLDNAVATPTFTPEGGMVFAGTEVSILCDTEGADIYYTLNDEDPTVESTKYTEPIVINEATTIKAKAFKEGMQASSIATATYGIRLPSENAATFVFFGEGKSNYGLPDDGNTYVDNGTSIKSEPITITLDGAGAWRYWSDGLRAYAKSKTPTFSVSGEGLTIQSIEIYGDNNLTYKVDGSEGDAVSSTGNDPAIISCDNLTSVKIIVGGGLNAAITSIKVNYRYSAPVLPKPTVKEGVTITETAEGWSVVPTEYPVELTFDVEDGMVVYHMIVPNGSEPAAAPAKEDDGHTVLENNILVLNAPGEVHSVYVSKNGVKSDKKKITAEVPTGIQGIAETTAPVQYFNLQGVRIDKPAKGGIYIRVQGGKSNKVVF